MSDSKSSIHFLKIDAISHYSASKFNFRGTIESFKNYCISFAYLQNHPPKISPAFSRHDSVNKNNAHFLGINKSAIICHVDCHMNSSERIITVNYVAEIFASVVLARFVRNWSCGKFQAAFMKEREARKVAISKKLLRGQSSIVADLLTPLAKRGSNFRAADGEVATRKWEGG